MNKTTLVKHNSTNNNNNKHYEWHISRNYNHLANQIYITLRFFFY